MHPAPRLLRWVFALAAILTVTAGFALGVLSPLVPDAAAQFQPTTTEPPPTTVAPTTTAPPPTTAAPTTTAPPATTTTVRRSSTTTTAPATTSTIGQIPTGSVAPPVTAPVSVEPDPGSGSMAWWIVALSPLGLAGTLGMLAYNWFKTRGT